MTQKIECQKCGEFIDIILTDKDIITYHKECWVEFQQELIEVARARPWRKLNETGTTLYAEE